MYKGRGGGAASLGYMQRANYFVIESFRVDYILGVNRVSYTDVGKYDTLRSDIIKQDITPCY